jgi:hypothetical protein
MNYRLAATVAALLVVSQGAIAQSINIFGNSTPQNPVVSDTNAVTLGVKFWSTQVGTVSGIRFYRGQANNNGYTVKLYTISGSLLASATNHDTCAVPCWEQIDFAAPISIAANTTYVAAYYTSNGDYADDETPQGGLTNGVVNGPLNAQASVPSGAPGGNGVYTYSTGFPDQTWHDSNYYVDVAFTPSAPTLMMSFVPTNPSIPASTAPGSTVATVNASWSDGSPFTGTLGFAAPYSDDSGTFALSGNSIIVNPSGRGVCADGGTVQNVTVVATQ